MLTNSTNNRLVYIEIGRGIACLMVVLFHTTIIISAQKYFMHIPLGGIFLSGYSGVDFFFVLSGFIIFYSTSKDHGNPARVLSYIKKRLIRIYPIYWFVCLLLLPFVYIINHVSPVNALMDFMLVPRDGFPFLSVAWTLRHEMFFYLSFVLFFINRTLAWSYFLLWGGAIVLSIVISLNMTSYFQIFYLNAYNLEFLLGMCVARFAGTTMTAGNNAVVIFILGAVGFSATWLNDWLINVGISSAYLYYHLLYGISAALMIRGLVELRANPRNYWVNVGTFFGKASYSIYLSHYATLSVLVKFLMPFNLGVLLNMVLMVFVSVVIGYLIYQYVEAPLVSMIRDRV